MELQEIEVVIDKNGNVELKVSGIKGTSCLEVTKALEAALGGELVSREMSPEAQEAVLEQNTTADRTSLRQ